MLGHLMAYDRTKLSVSQTLRPSTRTPCVLRLPSETIAPPPRPGAQDAGPESLDPGRRPVAGSQPGLLLLLRGPVPWPMLSRHLHVAKARLQPCQNCFFFGFLHAESRRTRDTFSASKTSLSFRTFEDSTFEQAEGSLLWKSTSFQVLCPFEQVP